MGLNSPPRRNLLRCTKVLPRTSTVLLPGAKVTFFRFPWIQGVATSLFFYFFLTFSHFFSGGAQLAGARRLLAWLGGGTMGSPPMSKGAGESGARGFPSACSCMWPCFFCFFFFAFCFFPMGNSSAAVLADGAGASTARASYKATPWKALL